MRWAAVFLSALILLFAQAQSAAAAAPPLLGFLSEYQAPDGSGCVHRGVDVAQTAKAPVVAPVSGVVTFVGRTPGPHGGSILVVTLQSEAGVVSMLPFDSVTVAQGCSVAKGESVGSVAESGDQSTAVPHLHLGLRRSGEYIDPSCLLQAVEPLTPEDGAADGLGQSEPQGQARVIEPAPANRQAVRAPRTSAYVCANPDIRPATAPEPEAVPTHLLQPARVAQPGQTLSEGVSVAPAVRPAVPGPSCLLAKVQKEQAGPGVIPASTTARAGGAAHLGAAELATSVAVALTFALLLSMRTVDSRIAKGRVSDRLGRLLQHLKAGDTLCGLTSCSGPTAFTVPGPLAQRR